MNADLLIVNGRITTSAGTYIAAIAVKDGRITAITADPTGITARETIDATGLNILPGIVDSEAHPGCYNPFRKDLESESRAAAAAGVTTWGVHQPSTRLGAEPFVEYVQKEDVGPFLPVMPGCIKIIEEVSAVDVFITPMVETDQQVAEIPQLAAEFGMTSYKLYCQSMKPELDKYWAGRKAGLGAGFDDGVIFGVMQQVAKLGGSAITQIHAENWQIARLFEKQLIEDGRTDFAAWTDRSPDFAETHHVRSFGYLAKITGSPLFIQHASVRTTHEEILRLRGEGVRVYGNTGPTWLYLEPNQKAWRINVPVRYPEEKEAVWKALAADRGVDSVSSDHVISWSPNAKEAMFNDNIWKLRTGFTSRVEMMLPVMLSYGVQAGRISLERAVQVLCENPAKIYGLYPKKGCIQVGADADFVFVDLAKQVTVGKDQVTSASGWSIVEGHTFTGWPVRTILRGKTISQWKPGDAGATTIRGGTHGRYLARVNGRALYPLT
jgi:dihydropyrimidinase/dihydroorotase